MGDLSAGCPLRPYDFCPSAMVKPWMQSCVGEFLGTYLLVLTVGCNVLSGNTIWGGVAIACVLMVLIYALAAISGANFNPAVTISLALTNVLRGPGDMNFAKAGMYILVQLLAGVCGAFTYATLFGSTFALAPAPNFGWVNAALCEFVYTMMLCFVVLNVAVTKKLANNEFFGLAIGFVIVAGAYGAGAVSGGCFNPAVALGIGLSGGLGGEALGISWTGLSLLIYFSAELAGVVVAVALFRVVRPNEFGQRNNMDDEPTISQALIAEFLGTFMLVLTVGLNVLAKSPAAAFSIAASLMCMIYALGDISGANFNPAVTLAILATKRDSVAKAVGYIAVQIIGGVCGAFVYLLVWAGVSFPLGPGEGHSGTAAMAVEFLFTFVLCYVVLCVAVSEDLSKNPEIFGLAIGSCVTIGGFAIGGISGGSLNPAVSFGIALSGGGLLKALLYIVAELAGGGAAALVYHLTHGWRQHAKDMIPLLPEPEDSRL